MIRFLTKKIPASTLIETIIAMVLLLTIAGVTLLIYLNIFRSNTSYRRVRAYELSQNIESGLIAEPVETEETIEADRQLHGEWTVSSQSNLYLFTIELSNEDSIVVYKHSSFLPGYEEE